MNLEVRGKREGGEKGVGKGKAFVIYLPRLPSACLYCLLCPADPTRTMRKAKG
jgi:hypothetical protein